MVRIKKDKHAWIEIVEAFVAILLIAGVILIAVNKGYFGGDDISTSVYKIELSIIREIQTNDTMREEILDISESLLPIEWEDTTFPATIRERISTRTPSYLECIGKICNTSDSCNLAEKKEQNVYAQSAIISPTVGGEEIYRKLNLFCWVK
jgi:hypothetical protein